MKKYVKYLKSDLKPALNNLPAPYIFEKMYGNGFREGDLSNVPVKTLGEWLGIDMVALPPSDRLTDEELDDLTETLLSYWQNDDELAQVIRHVALANRRYESAVEYLSIKGQYDGLGGFKADSTPIPPEELKKIRSPPDDLDWDKPSMENTEMDNGLPF